MPVPPRLAAQAAKTLKERRAQDALAHWEPTRPQSQFLAANESEVWFCAANRSGKSDALAACISSLARFGRTDPRGAYGPSGVIVYDKAVSIWAITLTFPLGRDVLQPKIFDNAFVPAGQPHKPFVPPWEIAHWTQTNQVLKLKNGSIIGFKSCDQGRDLFQGTGRDMVAFDEAPPYSVYDEATMRVEAGRRLFIRGAATLLPPEGLIGGVSWLFPKKIQPFQAGGVSGLLIIGASIYDNPYLLPEEITRLEAKYPLGSPDRRIRLEGEWLPGVGGALAWPGFNRAIHVNQRLTRDDREWRQPLMWCLDFNVEPMGTTVVQKVGRVYRVIDEVNMETANDQAIAEEFCRRFPQHGAALWLHGDATGRRRTVQTNKSDYLLIMEVLRRLPYPVELRVPEQNPPVRDRIASLGMLLRGVGGEVRFEVAPGCTETIADFEEVLLSPEGGIKKSTNRADPYSRRTAWTDSLSYMAVYNEPVARQIEGDRRPLKIRQPGYSFNASR